jgi:alpha-galactosidase
MSSVKLTVIGAGSVVFSLALVKDVCLTKGLSGSTITFMDIDQERTDIVHGLAVRYAEDLGANLTFKKTLDREEALTDADYVVNTATVTGNEYQKLKQRELSAKHGYYFNHHGFPRYHDLKLMLDVAQDIARLCPDAYLFQAGNPVFAGTTLMARETGINAVGICHGHYGYRKVATILGIDPDEVDFQAPGLNHNIWMTHFLRDGQDLYPLLDKWIENEAQDYWAEMQKTENGIEMTMSPSAILQYRMFGLMPIGDTPRKGGWWFHTGDESRLRWYGGPYGAKDTPEGRDRHRIGKDKKYEQMVKAATDPNTRPVDLFGSERTREQHVKIMDALTNDNEGWFQVNVLNNGALGGIADDVAVELPALINKKGIQPLRLPELPEKIMLYQINPAIAEMERNLAALLSGDMTHMLMGILDEHTTQSWDQAVKMLDALMHIEPNEPMKAIDDVNDHFSWPEGWPPPELP